MPRFAGFLQSMPDPLSAHRGLASTQGSRSNRASRRRLTRPTHRPRLAIQQQVGLGSSNTGGPRMSDAVLAREEELRQAQLSGDVTALERLLDDGLVFTALDGAVVSK